MRQTQHAAAKLVETNGECPPVFEPVRQTVRTVLVVEDEPDLREMMQVLLEDAGYAAFGAANGREALEFMRLRRPGLVLIDIDMPVLDGREFRRHQRADERLSDIPMISVTANSDPLNLAAGLKTRCVAKPFCLDELLGEVASACR
jgi:CheY-like chemotaxis protein